MVGGNGQHGRKEEARLHSEQMERECDKTIEKKIKKKDSYENYQFLGKGTDSGC